MRRLNNDDSRPRLFRCSRYHLRRLSSYPQTKELAAPFQSAFDSFVSARAKVDELSFEAQLNKGAIEGEDSLFEPVLSGINDHLLLGVSKDRNSPAYRAFFPSGRLAESTRAPGPEDVGIAQRIADASSAHPGLVPQALIDELHPIAQRIAELVSKSHTLATELANAKVALELAIIPLVRLYNEDILQLKLRFPERDAFVESFFYDDRSTKKSDED